MAMTPALAMPKLLDKQIDRLYSLPLEAFTRARDELVKGLHTSGDREGAARVRQLVKPTVAAWTVNQLARRNERELRALFSAVDSVREAQAAALEGGPGATVREASEAEREALTGLADAAREILQHHERPRHAVVDRVIATLRAGAADPESRRLVEAGRLSRELDPLGFQSLSGLAVSQASREHPGRRRTDRELELQAARQRVRGLQAEVQELKLAVRAAEGRVRDAEREAERMHREAEEARDDLRRAEIELESARNQLG
jgi:hypothetical protein